MKKISLIFAFFFHFSLGAKTSAIIEAWNTHFYLPSPNNLITKEYLKIKVLDEHGYDHAVYRTYYNTFRKVKNIKYTLYDANGRKIKKLLKYDAVDVMINPSYQIDDTRLLILDPKYRNYPFTAEIEIEVNHDGFLSFPNWMPRYAHDLEVKNATLTLECHKDFEYRSRECNGISSPATLANGEIKIVRWTVENLPPVSRQSNYKYFATDQGTVYLTPINFTLEKTTGNFEKWSNFGEWYLNLNEGRNALSQPTKDYLLALKGEYGTNVKAITKAVYQYMQSKTRYISIQLGIGGYQSIPSDVVEKTGYGDCKALTNYMKAMLDYLHIPSNYVLVYAGDDAPDILYDFPSNQFNHVFLAVPSKGDTLWFECTSQTIPPAFIGTFTDDRHVLWIDKGNSKIVKTPVYSASENLVKRKGVIVLDPQGDADIDLRISESGKFFDDIMILQYSSQEKINEFNYAKFPYRDFTIKKFYYETPDRNLPLLELNYKIHVNGLGKSFDDILAVPSNMVSGIEKEFYMDLVNKKSLVRRAFTIEDQIDLLLPENYRPDILPTAINDSCRYGLFEMKITYDEKLLHIYRKTVIEKGLYEKDTFDDFYSTIKKFRAYEQTKIIFRSKT